MSAKHLQHYRTADSHWHVPIVRSPNTMSACDYFSLVIKINNIITDQFYMLLEKWKCDKYIIVKQPTRNLSVDLVNRVNRMVGYWHSPQTATRVFIAYQNIKRIGMHCKLSTPKLAKSWSISLGKRVFYFILQKRKSLITFSKYKTVGENQFRDRLNTQFKCKDGIGLYHNYHIMHAFMECDVVFSSNSQANNFQSDDSDPTSRIFPNLMFRSLFTEI